MWLERITHLIQSTLYCAYLCVCSQSIEFSNANIYTDRLISELGTFIYYFFLSFVTLSTQPQIASATAQCHEWDLHMYLFGKDARINRSYMHGTYLVYANSAEYTNVTTTPKHAEWWCNLSLQWRFVSDRQCFCYALRCLRCRSRRTTRVTYCSMHACIIFTLRSMRT